MAQIKSAVAMISESAPKSESVSMNICSIPSVQRIVNFTADDGKMYFGEHFRGTVIDMSTICDLPLLFVNGFLSNLEKLTTDQLETFVPYMIQCSTGSLKLDTPPKWWPNVIEFNPKLVKPLKMSYCNWLKRLKMVVTSCYSYHGCEFALKVRLDRPLDQISLAWPYNNKSISKIPNHLTASCLNNEQGKHLRRGSKGNKHNQNTKFSRYQCFQCGSKFEVAEEIRNHEKICPRMQTSAISRLQDSYFSKTNSLNTSTMNIRRESSVRIAQNAVLRNQYSTVNQRNRLRQRTSIENSPLHVAQENFSEAKWSPNVLLYDCCKSRSGLDRKCGTLKNLPLSSINGEGRTKLNTYHDQRSPSLKRKKVVARKSLLPLGFRKETNNVYDRETISEIASVEIKKERDSYETVDCVSLESDCDVLSTQESFMKKIGLIDTSSLKLPSTYNPKPLGNPIRYSGVPVSSPLGNLIFSRSRIPTSVFLTKIEKMERYCAAKPLNECSPLSRFPLPSALWEVSWKERNEGSWNHNYSYPLKKWWGTPLLREIELKRRKCSYMLRFCKPCHVVLKRIKIEGNKIDRIHTVMSGRVKSETFQNADNLKKEFSLVPKLKKLSGKEIEAYMNVISPVLKRLTVKEIKKFRNAKL